MSSLYEATMLEDLYEQGREEGMTHQEAIKYAFATVEGPGDGAVAVGHRGQPGPDTHYPM